MKGATGILITLLLSLKTLFCIAQESNVEEPIGIHEFVIIADPEDSFVNLRNTPSIKGSIDEQLQNGKVMFAYEREGNWVLVEHSEMESLQNEKLTSGYVHKSRIKTISSLKQIKAASITANKAVFENKNITVEVTTKDFIEPEHTYKLDNNGYIELIDNKIPWGIDGGLPRTEYKEIIIQINGKSVAMPIEALHNLYEPSLRSTSVYYDADKDSLYIVATNSDGAGGYAAVFIIENKKYKERVLEIPF